MKRAILGRTSHGYCLTLTMVVAVIVMWLVSAQLSFGQEASNSDTDRNFSLLEGHGVPVCDAYLELLNKTKFEVTPFCGRPEEGSAKGFEHLDGHFMNLKEIEPLFTPVWEFMRFGDQHHVEKFFYPGTVTRKPRWSTDAGSPDDINLALVSGWTYVWRYAAPIDINNDGSMLNVITWQGYGSTGAGSRCGSDYAYGAWDSSFVDQRAFILNKDGNAIDENQTRSVFGAPAEAPQRHGDRQLPGGQVPAVAKPFRPLADSIGIFKYESRFYIETQNRPAYRGAELPPVHVYLREHGSARKVCTLRPESVPAPVD
jgi:hypothetical protein